MWKCEQETSSIISIQQVLLILKMHNNTLIISMEYAFSSNIEKSTLYRYLKQHNEAKSKFIT